MSSRSDEIEHVLPKFRIYSADGSGYNPAGCYNVISESAPLVLQSIRSASVKPGSVFTIADFGCADGATSMPLLYACVQELRKIHGDGLPIHVIYDDQPVNDFKTLFLRLQGLIPGPKSYFLDFTNVFVTTCGTSFYEQCLPPHSVNLVFSSTAMHWLTEMPCDITGALSHTMITVPEEAEKFRSQAAKDWETILLARAKEMASGGRMVLVQFAVDDEGQFIGQTRKAAASVHGTLRDLWRELRDEGLITKDEFYRTTFIGYFRTVNEFKAPFESPDSPVRKACLSLISIETKVVPCPYREKWLQNRGDPVEHARWFIPSLRKWSDSTFISALSDSRSPKEKESIVNELFKQYESEVAKRPEDHGGDYVHAYMVIAKNEKIGA